jgi:hypothetical protein
MENNISRIGNTYFKPDFKVKEDKEQNKNAKQEEKQTEEGKKQVDSKEVLSYLAAQNIDMVPVKKAEKALDVTKYVSGNQQASIEEIMDAFEANFSKALDIAKDEFPGISEETATELALAYINSIN